MATNPGNPRPSQLGMPKLSTSGPAQVVVARSSMEALQADYAWSLQSSTLYTVHKTRLLVARLSSATQITWTSGRRYLLASDTKSRHKLPKQRHTLWATLYGVLERCHVVPPTTKSRLLHFYAVRESLRSRQHSALIFKCNISRNTADQDCTGDLSSPCKSLERVFLIGQRVQCQLLADHKELQTQAAVCDYVSSQLSAWPS
jgi:hypothetical protein